MTRLLLLPMLLALMGADDCSAALLDDRDRAARALGPGSTCTWKTDGNANREVVCISGGRRFVCISTRGDTACVPVTP